MGKGASHARRGRTSAHAQPRPYFKERIAALERLFDNSQEDHETLVVLRHELGFRQTKRAVDLRARVEQALSEARRAGDPRAGAERRPWAATGAAPAVPRDVSPPRSQAPPAPWVPATRALPQKPETTADRLAPADGQTGEHANPDSVLAAWTTIEVLTPQPLPTNDDLRALGRTLVRLREDPRPWDSPTSWRRGRERAVFWFLYLGELDLEAATRSLLELFPERAAEERSWTKGIAPLAVAVLDHQGVPIESKAVLASFGWGYGKVRGGRLTELAGFPKAAIRCQREIEERITRLDSEGEPLPVDTADIDAVIDWLVRDLNLPLNQVTEEAVAVRVPVFAYSREPPEPELLNSFFLQDLSRVREAISSGDIGGGLLSYLSAVPRRPRQDVLRSLPSLEASVAPCRLPYAHWPGRGGHALVLMQQVAINHVADELRDAGLLGVNGPPGTGKTTLLRDLVAKVAVDRALALARFEDPRTAFSHASTLRLGPAFGHLYQLDPSLLGHEIVVASSNNKAVENISREIPAVDAVADDFHPPLHYFPSIADCVAANGADDQIVEGASWGLVAAVLGNKANRSAFAGSFWFHKQRGMAAYLRAIVQGWNEDLADEDHEMPEVVRREAAPASESAALERWTRGRERFRSAVTAVQTIIEALEGGRDAMLRRPGVEAAVRETEAALAAAAGDLVRADRTERETGAKLEASRRTEAESIEDRKAVLELRPGLLARWFRTAAFRAWHERISAAVERVEGARFARQAAEETHEASRAETLLLRERTAKLDRDLRELRRDLEDLDGSIAAATEANGGGLPDERFWQQGRVDLHKSSPWLGEPLQRARAELFAATFSLHRAFVDAAARPLRHNLGAAIAVMNGRALSETQESCRRSLWASLCLVVPVISTTFASVARLFGAMGREQIGWLLIDEAGQAAPQAAVGAIWRARRVLAIGDPLQIPPVVTIPSQLNNSIFREHSVSAEDWAAPEVSVQTLADQASWFGTSLLQEEGETWVGCPLRVHRRCQEPMFSISNQVAYNGMMVQATPEASSELGEVLGPSRWIDIEGEGIGKWSPDEGRVALELLRRALEKCADQADLFFITPFRIVGHNLRRIIEADPFLAGKLSPNPRIWARERVGTIHTFQGKEAEAVVLILGAPHEGSAGARWWAGSSPNLLNVAVSRAKRRIYVVGNRQAWKDVGVFRSLASMLPRWERSSRPDP